MMYTCVDCGCVQDEIDCNKLGSKEYTHQTFKMINELKQLKLNVEENALFKALTMLATGTYFVDLWIIYISNTFSAI